ncbi:MAG TPA: chromosome segregation protein SMC [Terracidiphilus sp.]|nr:chromosome segregation protein SMC [Terracidiphilus sp.]
MLKLKKIHILGFKSFCDRTELTVAGTGIAVVVGPNGCGKSNILDGVSWVLGEQSAKTLRGTHMQDVIFAGTRDRNPLGMAEVTLTMVDPETYEGPVPVEPEVLLDHDGPSDWDEEEHRRRQAAEAEEMAAAEQPGQPIEEEFAEPAGPVPVPSPSTELAPDTQMTPSQVVLKVRRRKFHRTPQKGEIVITRRLFRTGESEYLLNGKLCRLRDIQDIFMGTGLGPESYAIIGQERIGQLLSSKPHDRRAIIEEAAGITRFKTKKRLAELRLESAKQNLARVEDIFEEVTRQMNSLKRQASKAERFAALRDELRGRLRVVLASRMALMDAEQAGLNQEIASLTERINNAAGEIGAMEANQHTLTERGYQLDHDGQEAQNRANAATIELERASAREHANAERVTELEARLAAAAGELEQTQTQLSSITEERTQQRAFLETAANEAKSFRQMVETRQHEARAAAEEVFGSERQLEANRRHVMHLLTLAGNARNSTAQAEESLAALEREAERLESEMNQARQEREHLGVQSGQARLRFESAAESLQRLENEIAQLRENLQAKRAEDEELRARANELRTTQATAVGRRNSLEALIRDHSYSTDTVRRLLKPGALDGDVAPVGTLADFLEVSGQHEGVVDEFLREELNYVVVKSWGAAEEGVRLLKSGVDGRATFLIHDSAQGSLFKEDDEVVSGPGITPLRDAIRVLNGFGRSLETIIPKLKNGYIVENSPDAQRLAGEYVDAFFLTPGGECFHNLTVTGGKPASEGPLTLKRELREIDGRLSGLESSLRETEMHGEVLTRGIEELTAKIEALSEERRQAERDTADQGAALKQMEAEAQRIERRLQEWTIQAARNKDAREAKHAVIEEKREEALRLEAEHKTAELSLDEQQAQLSALRETRESLQQEAARVTAELAGLEERRRGAEAAFQRIDRLHADLERRVLAIQQQQAAAEAEREQRNRESAALAAREQELAALRDEAITQAKEITEQAQVLRQQLATMETELKTSRSTLDALRDQRSERASQVAKLRSDLEHLEASCLAEVNVEAAVLRTEMEAAHLVDEALGAEEEACRTLRQRVEQMGPVNMMALEEYRETADRHTFLEAQRKDLIESIENTQETIKEIDQISRTKFDEAFAKINENFGQVFTRLFHGGQAFLRLTDEENQAESGLDIVAQPPGKKLQNVLLLSGGEKALTALALLVGIFQFQPSPFCVLDEVDAALDETNVGRLADLLHSLSRETQFLLVTHSKRMMHSADMIYGVTMQEPGVSKVVSVRLGSQEQQRATA